MTVQQQTRGCERIARAFAQARQSRTAAFMPYFTLGYPDPATSLEVVAALAEHSDLLELGVPFSDPIADGPTIQHSTQVALEQGMTTRGCLELVRALRGRGIETPVMLMGYVNPILAYGPEAFFQDAAAAGVDGLIVPDLPPEEAGELATLAEDAGLALIYFLAPTSNPERIRLVAGRAQGFIYLVSITGITGTREADESELAGLIDRVRGLTTTPLAVGFGINTPARAAAVGRLADGVIVGSDIIKVVGQAETGRQVEAAGSFARELAESLRI